jgi:hypothetical protein
MQLMRAIPAGRALGERIPIARHLTQRIGDVKDRDWHAERCQAAYFGLVTSLNSNSTWVPQIVQGHHKTNHPEPAPRLVLSSASTSSTLDLALTDWPSHVWAHVFEGDDIDAVYERDNEQDE